MNNYTKETFVESPIYDNWFKHHYPEHSLLICSPYIKRDALDKIISLYNLDSKNSNVKLKVLIRGNSEEFTFTKSSDLAAFDSLISIPGLDLSNVRRISNLHMKAYLVDEKHLLITSGNLTNSGMFVQSNKENFEGGLSTSNPEIITRFLKYFASIWLQSEALPDFYDKLSAEYSTYIEENYSDKYTLNQIHRRSYEFPSRTSFDGLSTRALKWKESLKEAKTDDTQTYGNDTTSLLENLLSDPYLIKKENASIEQTFTLTDIPPVGSLDYIPDTLRIINSSPNGISYINLGEQLRAIFSDHVSNDTSKETMANRKFGEEKGKFATFFGFAYLERTPNGNIFKITNLGRMYLTMDIDGRNKLIKDIFFDKPIIVSILKHSYYTPDFDLLKFLTKNCNSTPNTLSRKIGPLKQLFSLISNICTETELQNLLDEM